MKPYLIQLMAASVVLLSQCSAFSAEEEEERLVILEVKDEYGKTTFEVKADSEEREWRDQRTEESRELIANAKKLKRKRNPKLVSIRVKKRNIKSSEEAQKYLQEYADRLKKVTRTKRIER